MKTEGFHFLRRGFLLTASIINDEEYKLPRVTALCSFSANLAEMTFGCSRDDAEGKFLSHYVDHEILPANPFHVLDAEGVGLLIQWAVEKGRNYKPLLKTGICGEHGGDKDSIFFCHSAGLDYVSCSPYRVPLARIAAAQAMLLLGDHAALSPELHKNASSL